jgi:hypothetical protein
VHAGEGVVFGHGLVIDLILWVGAVVLAWVVNASQANSDQQRVRGQRVLWVVAALALAGLLALDL